MSSPGNAKDVKIPGPLTINNDGIMNTIITTSLPSLLVENLPSKCLANTQAFVHVETAPILAETTISVSEAMTKFLLRLDAHCSLHLRLEGNQE